MQKEIIKTPNGDYFSWYHKGKEENKDNVLIFYHGLEGSAKIIKPLLNYLNDFDLYSIEERGHKESFQDPSISIKKHLNDIDNVVKELKKKYKKIFLIGESMGAVFTSLYGFCFEKINGVFCWSIPFNPKDIMIENKSKKNIIKFRTILTYFTGINYKYKSKIDYPKLTNSNFLLKLNDLNVETIRQTSEAVAVWKGGLKLKKMFYRKKPISPIFCWYGENDLMINHKVISKIKKNNFIKFNMIPEAKHIIMYEKNADLIFDFILNYIKQ